jgi:hypothetical protein
MEYVLVLYIYAGALAQGDSVALTSIPMQDKVTCEKAATQAESLVARSTKVLRTACLKVQAESDELRRIRSGRQ